MLFFSLKNRDEYGDVEGNDNKEQVSNMMAEIYHRGPIACGIAVTDDLYLNYTGGVYFDPTNDTSIVHDISVVGYGHDLESGWDFWYIPIFVQEYFVIF